MTKNTTKKPSNNKKDVIFLPLIFVSVVVVGILGLLVLQKLAPDNRRLCSYLGRLWMPDKEKNEPGFYKCYTYKEYYAYEGEEISNGE